MMLKKTAPLIVLVLMPFLLFSQQDIKAPKQERLKRMEEDSIDKKAFICDKEPRKNIVQWNFLSTFVLAGNFSYERVISKHTAILVGGYAGKYTLSSPGGILPYDTDIFATGGYLELKVFPLGKSPRGPYVAPYGLFRFFKLKAPILTGTAPDGEYTFGARRAESFNLSTGLTLGYRWILGNWFVVNPYLGAGYNIPRFHYFDEAEFGDFNTNLIFVKNYEIRFGLNLGIALK